MKNVIVIAQYSMSAKTKWDAFILDAKADKELPIGVQRVFYTSWTMDPHKNAKYLAGLVHSAKQHDVPLLVYELDDIAPILQVGCMDHQDSLPY